MVRTLIVDDSDSIRMLLREMLHSRFADMVIEEAESVQEGLAKSRHVPPDLVFVDIRLADGNGLELTERVKRVGNPVVVVIVLTSYNLPEYRHAASRAGADEFISKDGLYGDSVLMRLDFIVSHLPEDEDKPGGMAGPTHGSTVY